MEKGSPVKRKEPECGWSDPFESAPVERSLLLQAKQDLLPLGFYLWFSKYSTLLSTKDKFRVLYSIGDNPTTNNNFEIAFFKDSDEEIEKLIENITSTQQLISVMKRMFNITVGKRRKLNICDNVDKFLNLLKSSKNIMVLTGAGVSVSCGIPDFRSENGIYSRLDEFNLDDPQQMFDINYFREGIQPFIISNKTEPLTFYSFAKEIYPSNFIPSKSHKFIHLLEKKEKLLRNFTQNIDTLEQKQGIKKILQCHGSFATCSCIKCKANFDGKFIEPQIFNKQVPFCPTCKVGILKPDIIFFGESLPPTFEHHFLRDREITDLLIVIGSSLKVSPVGQVIERLPFNVPQVLINLDPLPYLPSFDLKLIGKCDDILEEICRRLEWDLDDVDSGQFNEEANHDNSTTDASIESSLKINPILHSEMDFKFVENIGSFVFGEVGRDHSTDIESSGDEENRIN